MSKRPETPKAKKNLAEAMARIEMVRRNQYSNLDLMWLGLIELPESVSQLANLRTLRLAANQLTTLPESIGQLTQLRELFLHDNRLTELPESISRLTQLRILTLSENRLKKLPESIGRLTQLRELYCRFCELKELPDSVGHLTRLEGLYLSQNKLTKLPQSLLNLRHLKHLYLHGNKALGLPAEIVGGDVEQDESNEPSEILGYYFRTRGDERRPLNEAKLILVGRGGVGKTSVVNRLIHKTFKDEKKTEGIRITEWPLVVGRKKDEVRLNVWDFGGQEIMHATHQFFLTERSLYLLVLSGREGGEDADAEYWLKLIQSFGDKSPVVVLNKIKEHPFDVNRNALQQKYPFIREFIKTDCKPGKEGFGIAELRRAVERETDRLEGLRDAFPAVWFSIKDKLAGMKRNYLSFDEYRKECEKLGEKDAEAQELLAKYLHRLGIALNYREDERLKDTHVLNPHWVTNGIYKILNANRLEKQKGEIGLGDLPDILDKRRYPEEMHGFLLELMKKFELCFDIPDKESKYLIPELLDKQEPEEAHGFKPEECLNFEYHYPVLPEGLLPRFVVRTNVLSDKTARWRTGVILKLEDNLALVKGDLQDRRVFIRIKGPKADGRRHLLSIIRANFDRIHADIRRLQPEEIVPLPGRPGSSVPYAELLAWEASGTKSFQKVVDGAVADVEVDALLNGVEVQAERPRAGDERGRAARIFVSYSHKDRRLLDELKVHLSPLSRMRLIEETWDDRVIGAGEDWRDKIDENLERADVFILLVSADSIASRYCFEKEFKRARELQKKNEVRIVPVIVRDANWRSIEELKGLQALPENGKAVTSWRKKDEAWRAVSEGIQKLIEELNAADPLRHRGR